MRTLSQIRAAQTSAAPTESKPQTSKPASNSPRGNKKPKPATVPEGSPSGKKTKKPSKPKAEQKPRELNPMCGIKAACDARAAIDPVFAAKYHSGKKTIMGAIQYVMGQLINGKAEENIHLHEKNLMAGGEGGKKMGFIDTDNAKDDALAIQYFLHDSLNCEPGAKVPTPVSDGAPVRKQPKDDADIDLDDFEEETAEREAWQSDVTPVKRKADKKVKPASTKNEQKPQPSFKQMTFDDLDDFDF